MRLEKKNPPTDLVEGLYNILKLLLKINVNQKQSGPARIFY